jgi:hypothetical protein
MRPVTAAATRRAALGAVAGALLLAGVLVGCAVLTLHAGPGGEVAQACTLGDCPDPTITVRATSTDPGDPGEDGEEDCYRDGQKIDCQLADGSWWYAPFQCYMLEVPQNQWPPADDPVYGGADPAEGTLYWCTDDWTGQNRMVFFPGEPPLDPRVLVNQVVAGMDLEPIRMGTAPESGPDRMGLVGMPVWLWVDQPDDRTYGPVSDGASEGPVSVSVTAKVASVHWDMGDGNTFACDNPGTPYEDRFGKSESPDCGHRYEQTSADQPDGVYTVTATSHWEVTWNANTGASGVRRLTRTATTELRVGEAQVLTQ